ncbi:putative helicase mov-10-B.2 [Styela clava]
MPIYANIYDVSTRKAGEKFLVNLYESGAFTEIWDREELTEMFEEYLDGQNKNFNEVLYHMNQYHPTLLYVKRHTVVAFVREETDKLYDRYLRRDNQDNSLFDNTDENQDSGRIIPGRKPIYSGGAIPASPLALHAFQISDSIRKIVSKYDVVSHSVEQKMKDLLTTPLVFSKYPDKFHSLLHIEELQHETDMMTYDMKSTTLFRKKNNNNLFLNVPGLAEKRPSVLKGDRLLAKTLDMYGNPGKDWYEGYVHGVRQNDVEIQFDKNFHYDYISRMKVYIQFRLNRHPLKMMHRTLTLVKKLKKILFPVDDISYLLRDAEKPKLPLKTGFIENNPHQVAAIQNIVKENSSKIYIIYGPPGTGKTVTMVESVFQTMEKYSDFHILVAAPSNSACDLLVERLLELVDEKDIWRLTAPSRINIPESMVEISRIGTSASRENLSKYKIIVSTLITAGRIASANFEPRIFDRIFIDECGQSMEPELLVAVSGIIGDEGKVVLAGDPKQLGPIIRSRIAKKHGLQTSFLERLMGNPLYVKQNGKFNEHRVTKLLKNYRSHEAIIKISNEEFYDNELEVCADELMRNSLCSWGKLPQKNFPVIFHDVRGKDEQEKKSPSFFNSEEVKIVGQYVENLLSDRRNRVELGDIGIIAPYRSQVQKINEELKQSDIITRHRSQEQKKKKKKTKRPDIKIGSVEEFQGQERRVIIISTVRSNEKNLETDARFRLGFLADPKRFNVAVTRAKSLLVVIGNSKILCMDKYWRKLYDFCKNNGSFIGTTVAESKILDLTTFMPTQNDDVYDITEDDVEDSGVPEWKMDS